MSFLEALAWYIVYCCIVIVVGQTILFVVRVLWGFGRGDYWWWRLTGTVKRAWRR